ncbi:Ig-like domain-containing protein, partial [bacterium]|nr:Ig-like domain-containing protein [bacterium]
PSQVYLYYTTDSAAPYSWTYIGTDTLVDGTYPWIIPTDGSYGWFVKTDTEPLPTFSDTPQASYYIFDINPPEIVSTVPINGASNVYINREIIITFSEAMDNNSLSYLCSPDPGGWTITWIKNNHEAVLTHANFAFTTTYTFSVTAADDLFGRSFVAGTAPNPWTFSTEATDLRPPTITSSFPFGTDAPAGDNIVIIFNESMNTASCENAFSYSDGIATWTIVDGVASWNPPANNQMTFNPTSNLNYLTSYTVTVASTASDVNGNDLDGNKNGTSEGSPLDDCVWVFTTQDVPDLTPPTSSVGALDPYQDSLTFTVPWTASDDTGILYVELYYTSDGGSTWSSWGSTYSSSPITFSSMLEGEY